MRKGKQEIEVQVREWMNSGRRMDSTRANSVGSVYHAKETLTIKMHTDAEFDFLNVDICFLLNTFYQLIHYIIIIF